MRRLFVLAALALALGATSLASAQSAEGRVLTFRFGGATTQAPTVGTNRIELLPVLRLLGADAAFSPAAGTYGVTFGDHVIQFAPGYRFVLVDGTLREVQEAPVSSPLGVAATADFLDQVLLAPLGYHLEPSPDGYTIAPGGHFAEPVLVRPAAADFGSTTTLVLTLSRAVPTSVTAGDGEVIVRFPKAPPQFDGSPSVQSRRVAGLTTSGAELRVRLAAGTGLLSSHRLDNPPRVILELGRRMAAPTPTPSPMLPGEGRSAVAPIVLDPGHGGDDTGATSSSGLMEKNVTLAIAQQVAEILRARGHVVRLTRDDDTTRALSDRTALANRLDASVFVSLHANASPVHSVRGAETYYMSLDQGASDEAAAATAQTENQAGPAAAQDRTLDLILWNLAQAEVLNESSHLALDLQQRLNSLLDIPDRGVKQAPFVVLTGATMPAALVEVGFLSNPEESRRLGDPGYRHQLAVAIADGIEDFLSPAP